MTTQTCPHVQHKRNYREIHHPACGTHFCKDCPDLARLPRSCPGICDPAIGLFRRCKLRHLCPCAHETNAIRAAAFTAWLLERLSARKPATIEIDAAPSSQDATR